MYDLNIFKDKNYINCLKILFADSSYEMTTNKRKIEDQYFRKSHKTLNNYEQAYDNILDESHLIAINEDDEAILAYYSETYNHIFILELDASGSIDICGDSPSNFIEHIDGVIPRPHKRNFVKSCMKIGIDYKLKPRFDFKKDLILKSVVLNFSSKYRR